MSQHSQTRPFEVICRCDCAQDPKNEPEAWGWKAMLIVIGVFALLMGGLAFSLAHDNLDGIKVLAWVVAIPTAGNLLAKAATSASDFDRAPEWLKKIVYCARDIGLGLALTGGLIIGAITV